MIEFNCMTCGHVYRVPESTAGKTGKCKHCGNGIRVPMQELPENLETPAARSFQSPQNDYRRLMNRLSVVCVVLFAVGVLSVYGAMQFDSFFLAVLGGITFFPGLAMALFVSKFHHDLKASVSRKELPPTPKKVASQMAASLLGIGICVALCIGLCAGVGSMFSGSGRSNVGVSDAGNTGSRKNVEAWTMATEFVKDQLKSPSTASFGNIFKGEYQDPDRCVTAVGDNVYEVRGWVDAQNSFGAMIRTQFNVQVKDNGGGSWSLLKK